MSEGASPGPVPGPCDVGTVQRLCRHDATRTHGCRLVDTRRLDAPPDDHLPGSAWIPWPERVPAFLLPPRGTPLVTWGAHAEACALRLADAGWPARWWNGDGARGRLRPGPPSGALWDVDPLLRRVLARLPGPDAGPVLDIGSGSSREGIFLAQRGYDVVLVDRLPDALDLGRERARHHGVASRVRTHEAKVRQADDLPAGPFAIALDFRFLRRGVLEGIADRLVVGGAFVLRSYGKPSDEGGLLGRGPRNPTERLGVDEARSLLGDRWRWVEPPRLAHERGALWVTAVGLRDDID